MEHLQNIYFENLNVVSHLCGLFSIDARESWALDAPIMFNQNKFYYIQKGRCIINIEDEIYHGEPGSWFFIPANKVHSYYNLDSEPFEKYWIHFDLHPSKTNIFDLLGLPYCIKIGKNDKIIRLFDDFVTCDRSNTITDKIHMKSCLMDLVAQYISVANPKTHKDVSESNSCINEILSYISDNLNKPITNESLAEMAHMHPNNLIRLFKDKTTHTPAKYVTLQRLNLAKELLESSELSVTEIAERIGIEDGSHFSKLFKKFYSMSPVNYRKCHKTSEIYGE